MIDYATISLHECDDSPQNQCIKPKLNKKHSLERTHLNSLKFAIFAVFLRHLFSTHMNTAIQAALDHAVQSLQAEGVLPSDWNNNSNLTRTKDRSHGDFASNIAMIGAKAADRKSVV